MIFIVVIGGIGTMEGPIIGVVIFYLLQYYLAALGFLVSDPAGDARHSPHAVCSDGSLGPISRPFDISLFPIRAAADATVTLKESCEAPLLLPPLRALPALHLLQKNDLKVSDAEVDRERPVEIVWYFGFLRRSHPQGCQSPASCRPSDQASSNW